MLMGIKDVLRLVGISIVCFCAVFVCTFMLNYYLDIIPLRDAVPQSTKALYEAQVSTAKMVSAISGFFLAVIAAVMLIFYVKLYVDGHSRMLGVLKALGMSRIKMAASFRTFGLSVLIGAAAGYGAGYIAIPFVYKSMTFEGIEEVGIGFHPLLLVCLVFVPAVFYTVLSCVYAYFVLNRTVGEMIKGKAVKIKKSGEREGKERSFLKEMAFSTLSHKKSLAVFITVASFCFSAMVQMGISMYDYSSAFMAVLILAIGLILACTALFMSLTWLINLNIANLSVMKAFGYTLAERSLAVLSGYIPFALLGFGVGTVYQYGLLYLMINYIFESVGYTQSYSFDVSVFFVALAAFIAFYSAVTAVYTVRIGKISVRTAMERE